MRSDTPDACPEPGRRAQHPTPDEKTGIDPLRPVLSVVVIGRNEGARLLRCLQSVRAMASPGGPIELIYVDTASSDGSAEHAAELGANVHVVGPQQPSAALARNVGWRAARAAVILFLDGDTILYPRFVADAWSQLDDPRVAVVCGQRREAEPRASVFHRVIDLDWLRPAGPTAFCGGDALVRRCVLDEVGGYDETLIAGEEPELCSRLRARGYVVLRVDLPMTLHDLGIRRWSQYWRRALRSGHAYAEVAERTASSAAPLWGDVVRRNRVHAITVLGLPILGAALSWSTGSHFPWLVVIAVLAALVLRTAWRARWRSDDLGTLLLYAVHSHLQQLPILVGQMSFYWNRRRGRRRRLVEYKEPA
jgi:cellulose synthase/poly-beta-1,6-N-acetylglucosamine synthase-like glycosyltransferase